jgi:hypothetical protein
MKTFTVSFLDWQKLGRDGRWNLSCSLSQEEAFLTTVRGAVARNWVVDLGDIKAESLEDVFRILNTEDRGQPRSLSVGDVVMDDATCEEWVVAAIGFKRLLSKRG